MKMIGESGDSDYLDQLNSQIHQLNVQSASTTNSFTREYNAELVNPWRPSGKR